MQSSRALKDVIGFVSIFIKGLRSQCRRLASSTCRNMPKNQRDDQRQWNRFCSFGKHALAHAVHAQTSLKPILGKSL
eukprot:s1288_g9.t1